MRFVICALMLAAAFASAANAQVKVGFGQDKPPFVSDNKGIEVSIVEEIGRRTGTAIAPVFMSNLRLQKSLGDGEIDVAASVPESKDYIVSSPFISFNNGAFTLKSAGIRLDSLGELRGKSIVAWQNARGDLGAEFTQAVADNAAYKEIPSQLNQVKMFLSGRADAIVIDKDIFSWHVKSEGAEFKKTVDDYEFHKIIPGYTHLYLGFRRQDLRDQFDKALQAMNEDGTYRKIIDSYVR